MSNQRDAEDVLAAWREIERQLERASPGSPEAEDLEAEVSRLRDEYQRLMAAFTKTA